MRLSGFPKKSIVALQALRIEEGDGEEDEDVTTRPMATVSTDGKGAATVRCVGGGVNSGSASQTGGMGVSFASTHICTTFVNS